MEKYELHKNENCVYYVSSKCRTWEPAKSIILLAPDKIANSISRLETFAQTSGWLEAGEQDGAVVILPVAANGWAAESTDRIKNLYKSVWKDTLSPDPRESLQNVWCWETLIFAVGYEEGAVFAGNAAVDHPNAFAQVIMVNGVPSNYDGGEKYSDRWLVPDASEDWQNLNRDVPVAVWMLGNQNTDQAVNYFSRHGQDMAMVSSGSFGAEPGTTRLLLEQMNTRIRWKNSPDGTPARIKPKYVMDTDGEYTLKSVSSGGNTYDYYVRLPKGISTSQGLPVVVCMHGHGEPAWMFAQKNGWPELQDETGEFLFVSPDSPEHTWKVERDEGMHELMLEQLEKDYGIDRTRIYLTGFSNGSMATCWYGTRHPHLYAALSPWNSPLVAFEQKLMDEGWEMPMFAINGDLDHKMDNPRRSYPNLFKNWITLNGGKPRKAEICKPWPWKYDEKWTCGNVYTQEKGYIQGNRLTTYVYNNLDGENRFCFTEVKNMPHGAIHEQARATWNFMKRFSRPAGSKRVVDSEDINIEPLLDRHTLPSGGQALVYVPTSANSYTPSRSLVIVPGSEDARDEETVKAWLDVSGWIRQANKDGSVLLIPFSGGDWKTQDIAMIKELYRACWGKTRSREQGNVKWERGLDTGGAIGNVWMWEVLWNIIGYQDGAAFAGAAAARYPNRFASVTLMGDAPDAFPGHDVKSDHFMVSKEEGKNPARMIGVSDDYDVRMDEIPSAVWMITGESNERNVVAANYFCKTAEIPGGSGKAERFGGYPSWCWRHEQFPARQVILSTGIEYPGPQELMDTWIGSAVRWKNSPDGTLQRFWWKDEVETGISPYEKQSFRYPTEQRNRDYYVYRPANLPPKAPVLITIHGHGEPAWMFISKNGWPQLADKEGILIVSPQDNSENRWHGDDDSESFLYLVQDILCKYDVDPERIYISGFSNGNFQCYGAACLHPELFAAMWPMSQAASSSVMRDPTRTKTDLQRLQATGLEMPLFGVTGDNDGWAVEEHELESDMSKTVEVLLKLGGTAAKKAENPAPLYWQPDEIRDAKWYEENYHFYEADRFHTWIYNNDLGQPRISITVMKNMPHGTIWEETIAAWDFLKHFSRRPDGSIQYV